MAQTFLQLVRTQRGRGLAAACDISAGSIIIDDSPLVAHYPSMKNEQIDSAGLCPHCYRKLRDCALLPCLTDSIGATKYKSVLKSQQFELVNDVLETQEKFPILAARLALMRHFADSEAKINIDSCVSNLVAPSHALDSSLYPQEWVDSYHKISVVYSKMVSEEMDLNWYIGVIGKLHLNSIRTDKGISALYPVSSYFNHGCRPNIEPLWDGSHVQWQTTVDFKEGDEFLINYRGTTSFHNDDDETNHGKLHDEMPESARDEYLYWNYGFKCSATCSCGRYSPTK